MKLLLDQGLPHTTSIHLHPFAIEAEHAGDVGLASASDDAILAYARDHDQTIATLDADFHARLALSGARKPSVVRIRIEGLRAQKLASLIARVLADCRDKLDSGAVVSVTQTAIRVRRLPIVRS